MAEITIKISDDDEIGARIEFAFDPPVSRESYDDGTMTLAQETGMRIATHIMEITGDGAYGIEKADGSGESGIIHDGRRTQL